MITFDITINEAEFNKFVHDAMMKEFSALVEKLVLDSARTHVKNFVLVRTNELLLGEKITNELNALVGATLVDKVEGAVSAEIRKANHAIEKNQRAREHDEAILK